MFKLLGNIWYTHYIQAQPEVIKERKLVREFITRKFKTMFVKSVIVCIYICDCK